MKFRNIKLITALWQDGVEEKALDAFNSAIKHFLQLAGVLPEYRQAYSYKRGIGYFWLLPFSPINTNEFIEKGREESEVEDHLNSAALLGAIIKDPANATDPKYNLMLVKEPLHWKSDSTRSVGGVGLKNRGAVVTYAHLTSLLEQQENERWEDRKKRLALFSLFVQMMFWHELGHVAELYPKTGPADPTDEELKNMHCQNDCVMYWQHSDDLFNRIKARSDAEAVWSNKKNKIFNPFCQECLAKLQEFFIKP